MTTRKVFRYTIVFFVVISMHNVALFGENFAHQQVIGALIKKLAAENVSKLNLQWRSAVRGYGRVVTEFARFLQELESLNELTPDLIVIATDANCKGFRHRSKEFRIENPCAPIVQAIPDPHIERWLLLDGAAFKSVFGKGCASPDLKCDRSRYKHLLTTAIRETGIVPSLGGIEFAEDIVSQMDIKRAAQQDESFAKFADNIQSIFRDWKLTGHQAL